MLFKRLLLLLILPFVLVACVPAVQGLVELPDEARLLIVELITAALAAVFLFLFNRFGWDLSGYVQPIVAILAPIIITIIEHYLQLIPPVLDNVVLTVIHLIVLLIGSIGTILIARRLQAGEAKSLLA